MRNLLNRNDLNLSLKFGFLGLGMGGCSIAYECASIRTTITNNHNPYTALLINTNEVDLRKFKESSNVRKLQLSGYEKGAGRDIEIGEAAFKQHKELIQREAIEHFADRDFVWVTGGLGGGTGTGSILEAIRMLYASGFKNRCGLMITLPRDNEGSKVIENALERLQMLAKAMNNLGCILVVDNQKLYNDFIKEQPEASISEYLDYSNKYIATTLHEINVVTASFNPIAGYHYDSSELLNTLNTSGLISLGKLEFASNTIDTANQSTFLPDFKRSIERGILSDGYNLSKASRIAVSMVTHPGAAKRIFSMSFINSIETTIDGLSPMASEKPVAAYEDPKGDDLSIYTIVAGLGLPNRVNQLVVKAKEAQKIADDIFGQEDSALSALSGFTKKKQAEQSKSNSDDPFAAISEVASTKQTNDDDLDPFAILKSE
ncbi:plasmid replication protein [Paenibacillus cremeus]|uniref:Plasmid replication protein n=1 Tax=Paenibacillus cremeus TaxID=2163881 RepID=A0A559K586_9BACL|nr:plasmid replication protein [Paenibacillus cremeus]TVY07311.1 plasmid replication protein [Paenibacillus cremeus]